MVSSLLQAAWSGHLLIIDQRPREHDVLVERGWFGPEPVRIQRRQSERSCDASLEVMTNTGRPLKLACWRIQASSCRPSIRVGRSGDEGESVFIDPR